MELLLRAHRDVGGSIVSAGGTGTFDEHGRRALKHLGGDHPELQKAVQTVFDVDLQQVASVGTGYGRATGRSLAGEYSAIFGPIAEGTDALGHRDGERLGRQ